jgi:hypothetical protein
MPADFHLISLPLGDEPEVLAAALEALSGVEEGETAFLPEYVAWTARGSGRAFATLIAFAQARKINIVTTLNLGGDLIEDLPGAGRERRYNAVTIFTRYGTVHVPQAKITPQAFEMSQAVDGPDIGVDPYARSNRVRIDMDESILDARFLICSDLMVLYQHPPAELACDLLVVLGNFAFGAEKVASRLLSRALEAGVAHTALLVNAHHEPNAPRRRPLAVAAEEAIDAPRLVKPRRRWPSRASLRAGFHVYPDEAASDFIAMCKLPRGGRIAVPRSRWGAEVTLAEYPVTVVF